MACTIKQIDLLRAFSFERWGKDDELATAASARQARALYSESACTAYKALNG